MGLLLAVCWEMLPSHEQKSTLIFLKSLRCHPSKELQGQRQAERLLSLQPGHPPYSRGAESPSFIFRLRQRSYRNLEVPWA